MHILKKLWVLDECMCVRLNVSKKRKKLKKKTKKKPSVILNFYCIYLSWNIKICLLKRLIKKKETSRLGDTNIFCLA